MQANQTSSTVWERGSHPCRLTANQTSSTVWERGSHPCRLTANQTSSTVWERGSHSCRPLVQSGSEALDNGWKIWRGIKFGRELNLADWWIGENKSYLQRKSSRHESNFLAN